MSQRATPWPLRPIGELLSRVVRPVAVKDDETYREIGVRSHGKGIFYKPPTSGKRIGDKRVFWVEPGCLVFNIIFAWEQAVALTSDAESGMIASHRFPMYRSRNGELLPEYAWRYFASARGKYALGIASPGGAGRNKTLGQDEFMRVRIPVPPTGYQLIAVRILALADRTIGLVRQLVKAKRKLKEALADQLVASVRSTHIGGTPSHERLGNLVCMYFSNVDKKRATDEVPVRLCNYTDVYYNDQITAATIFMEATASECEIDKFALKKWDVIVTKDSETPDDIAKPALVAEDLPGVLCGYHLAILRPIQIYGPFLAQALRTSAIRHELYRVANGVTRFGLSQSSLEALVIPVPDRPAQEFIAGVLGAADREIGLLEKQLTAFCDMKEWLTQQLLLGRVHIPRTMLKETAHA